MNAHADPNFCGKADGSSVLFEAVKQGNLDFVDMLIEAGANVDTPTLDGMTPLCHCAGRPDEKAEAMFERLLKVADVNTANGAGKTAMHWVVSGDNTNKIRMLIAAGGQVDTADKNGFSPLVWSVLQRQAGAAQVLIGANANVNASSSNGYTPLMWAVKNGDAEMVKILIAAGVDVEAPDMNGTAALVLAAGEGNAEIVKAIVAAGASTHAAKDNQPSALSIARAKGFVDLVAVLGDTEEKLMIAATAGDIDTVSAILAASIAQVNLDYRNKEGRTAVMMAVAGGHASVAKALIDAGADLDVEDVAGMAVADLDPWLVADAISQGVAARLEPLPTITGFLTATQAYPLACVFAAKTIGLSDEAIASIRAGLTDKLIAEVNRRTRDRLQRGGAEAAEGGAVSLHDVSPIAEILHTFVDAPLERLRAVNMQRDVQVPQWLGKTVVAAAFAAFADVMDRKVAALTPKLIAEYRRDAQAALADDHEIYSAVLTKMANKHAAAYAGVTEAAAATRARVKAAFPARPTQPALDAGTATLLDLKVQAANVAPRFIAFMQESVANGIMKAGGNVNAVRIAPVLKKASRIIQKWWLRKEIVSICDVVRALATVPDFQSMRSVHTFLVDCDEIEIVDFKDRLNRPTSGGCECAVHLAIFCLDTLAYNVLLLVNASKTHSLARCGA
jgi:ankyrin repeat protein